MGQIEAKHTPVYDPATTMMKEAAVRCGLRIKALGDSKLQVALVDDSNGELVFEGARYPSAWDFMRKERGLKAVGGAQ